MTFPKNLDIWLPAYMRDRARHALGRRPAKRLWVAMTDHFEPHGKATLDVAHKRMAKWQERWPAIAAAAPRDAQGRLPCFTAFYPQEEYHRDLLNTIAGLCKDGTMDVEVHLHHFEDTAENFVRRLTDFTVCLHEQHGLLHEDEGRLTFGFIHGNWALDNSRPDGKCCGITGELQLLRKLGCYADFTMPSIPSPTQSRIVNQVYWTTGDPSRPRGFDCGVEASVVGGRRGDMLMITGPTGLLYGDRLLPRLEGGEYAAHAKPSPYRVKRWLQLAPRIGDDIFLKLFGHTAREDNAETMLGSDTHSGMFGPMFEWIHEAAREQNLELHWVNAFEMFKAVDRLVKPQNVAE